MTCDSLPISDALVARIRDWQARYDAADDAAGRAGVIVVEMWDGFDWPAFQHEAESVAAAMRDELPGWDVVCFDSIDLREHLLARDP